MPIVKCSGRDENLWNEKWSFNFWAATGQTAVFVDFVRTEKPIKGWRREGHARRKRRRRKCVPFARNPIGFRILLTFFPFFVRFLFYIIFQNEIHVDYNGLKFGKTWYINDVSGLIDSHPTTLLKPKGIVCPRLAFANA